MAAGRETNRVVAGRYKLVGRLGSGAMGTVWRAFDQMLQTEAALKEIDFGEDLPPGDRAERVERALREARHAAKLRGHPHVVTILDVVVENGLPWIVMELVPSKSLYEAVRDGGPLPARTVARIGVALIDALSAAHALGILHRDVKPSNVLIGPSGRVVLTDFGISVGADDSALTVSGVVGTPSYMAPERLNGDPATPLADIFGLGSTLYYAVEGTAPFHRETFGATLAAILFQPPAPTRRAGPLDEVLAGLLDKDPATRITAERARGLLEEIAAGPEAVADAVAGAAPAGRPLPADGPEPATELTGAAGDGRRGETGRGGGTGRGGADPVAPTRLLRGPATTDPAAPADRPVPRRPRIVARADVRTGFGFDAATVIAGRVSAAPDPVARTPSAGGPTSPRVVEFTPAGGGDNAPLPPPSNVTAAQEEDGAVVLRWDPSPFTGTVSYRVLRVVSDPSAPGGRRERSLGSTTACELSDGGVPVGVAVWHEVTAVAKRRRSVPVRTPTMEVAPDVTALRATMDGDAVALTWELPSGRDEVLIERAFDETSSLRGAMRRITASGHRYLDHDAQPGATYRYRVRSAYTDRSGRVAHTPGAEVVLTVTVRPRPVLDMEAETVAGVTTLRWTSVPGSLVGVYATAPDGAGPDPLGAVDHEVLAATLEGRERLVGQSRRGRLYDNGPDGKGVGGTGAGGEILYTPVSVSGNRAVIGRTIRHHGIELVHNLRVVDDGDAIMVTFEMPRGVTEARVVWRRDNPPTGPDDPEAQHVKVTNTSLEIHGACRLPAPADGAAYHVSVYPLDRTPDGLRPRPVGASVLARAATAPKPTPSRKPAPSLPAKPPLPVKPAMPVPTEGPAKAAGPAKPALPVKPAGPVKPAIRREVRPAAPKPVQVRSTAAISASYSLTRTGALRRALRVEVRGDGPLPDLVLVVRPGTTPPQSSADGTVIGQVPATAAAATRSIEISAVDLKMPFAVRLLPAPGVDADELVIWHPADSALVVR